LTRGVSVTVGCMNPYATHFWRQTREAVWLLRVIHSLEFSSHTRSGSVCDGARCTNRTQDRMPYNRGGDSSAHTHHHSDGLISAAVHKYNVQDGQKWIVETLALLSDSAVFLDFLLLFLRDTDYYLLNTSPCISCLLEECECRGCRGFGVAAGACCNRTHPTLSITVSRLIIP